MDAGDILGGAGVAAVIATVIKEVVQWRIRHAEAKATVELRAQEKTADITIRTLTEDQQELRRLRADREAELAQLRVEVDELEREKELAQARVAELQSFAVELARERDVARDTLFRDYKDTWRPPKKDK